MFGLKLKSWMEAHLGRPHRQKSTSSVSGTSTGTSSGSHPPPPLSNCSSSASSHQKGTGAPKDIASSGVSGESASNSTTNSTASSSDGSTTTTIGIATGSLLLNNSTSGNNNPTSGNFQPTTSILPIAAAGAAATTTSSTSSAVGSESVTGSVSAHQQEAKIGKYGGGGGGLAASTQQKGETIGTANSELDSLSHAPGEREPQQPPQHRTSSAIIPASSNTNSNRGSTVSTSVSNSTSILSGGSSFCNSLSSPDTGYSTDGYSPKSVYPALSFTTEGHTVNKHNSSASSSSTASKSSYTISSLVSSELLHSSSSESKQTSASCSVQDGLDEHAPSPTTRLLTSSQSSSSGISDTGSSGAACFPKGLQPSHHSIPENDSTCSKEKQVIMGVDGDYGEQHRINKKSIQLELEQKLPPSETTKAGTAASSSDLNHSHSKFSPFSIDFLKRSTTGANNSNSNNNGGEQENSGSGGGGGGGIWHRSHRRAESMDARTPSHEDYKPLVNDDERDDVTTCNPSSHILTTGASSSSTSAKSIRTSFVLNNSGQILEFSSYKNAYWICSPRRERTRIKTNPWITLSNNKKDGGGGGGSKSGSANNKATHANPSSGAASSSGSDGETEKRNMSSSRGCENSSRTSNKEVIEAPLEAVKAGTASVSDSSLAGSKRVNLLEINKKKNEEEEQEEEETDNFMEDETGIVDHDSDDRSSGAHHILYRISSASDSGKGSLADPETNRNSTESSCLLSEDSTRNSIISQEVSGSSCCGRSSSGESISQHQNHHRHDNDRNTPGHVSSSSPPSAVAEAAGITSSNGLSDQKEQQQGFSQQNRNSDQDQRTFRNASVATTDLLVKSASVSVGVGTTGSNKSAIKDQPVMVDKETDILSDWATNTDVEDTEDDLETDRDEGENNEDNETVTPAPSSPGTDVDRALFSQSSSATTDIDFGDSSAATQASSTQVFPPSSLLRQHHNSNGNAYANTDNNGARFHNNGSNNNSQSESCGGESYEHHYHLQQHNNINMNSVSAPAPSYPAVIPIVRPVVAAATQQHNNPDGTFSFDLVNHHHPHHNTYQPQQHSFQPFYPNFPMEEDLLEDDYPQIKQSSGHKGLARGALGFLRKIFKKGACSSQRRSPDSLASSSAGKKNKGKGKSDNNLASIGRGSPLLTISEPLSNPRYSAAVLTTKKQMNSTINGCYFLTPTPNSFRRRGVERGGFFGGQSDVANNSGSDSKGSSCTSKQMQSKIKTDIIRLPQGPLSPIQAHSQQRATSSSHSSGSSSSCSALSISNTFGIPQQCSTFLPHAAPVIAPSLFPVGAAAPVTNGNLIATINKQSNSTNNTNNSSSTNSSIHSLMSTSTCSGNNRPPSQQQSNKILLPISQNLYANSSSATQNPITSVNAVTRNSGNPFVVVSNNGSNNNNANSSVTTRSPPPPVISENSPYLNGGCGMGNNQQIRRDFAPPSQQQSLKGIIPPSESSSRIPPSSTTVTTKMNSPSFNNSYSPIHRLVVTGGSHLRNGNPPSNNGIPATGYGHYPPGNGESPLPAPRYNRNGTDNNSNNFATQVINRSHPHHLHPSTSMGQSPLINHRSSPHTQQYPPAISATSSAAAIAAASQLQPQSSHNFFASPSPILRNPRYQYIASSNQNSPVLNGTKRLNGSTTIIMPCSSSGNGGGAGPNGVPPLLTTFTPLPSSSSVASSSQRESLINNNNNGNANTNTITIGSGGSVNLNPSPRQAVSSSLSYNEFENLSRQQQQNFSFYTGNNATTIAPFIPTSSHLQQQQQPPPPPPPQQQQQLLHQSHNKTNKAHHHLQQNHYYSSPIVKQRAQQQLQVEQTLWNNNERRGGGEGGMRQYQNLQQKHHHQQRTSNQNLRFNSFLVRTRQLPQFYHTQWGLQERIYETVDSEDEQSNSGRDIEGLDGVAEMEHDLPMPLSTFRHQNHHNLTGGGIMPKMKHSYSSREGGFHFEGNQVNGDDFVVVDQDGMPTKRSKPKSLSASGKPFPRPVVALPMLPVGTFLSETETRLLEADKASDRKYKRLINEAEALLKEISVEKEKRAAVAAVVGAVHQRENVSFMLEDCPQSDPLRRKAYDCWALRRLQQELAGCCASPPVLHRSRLNLQSPSTPTMANNPYLNPFQSMGMSMAPIPPMLPQQVPYMNSATGAGDPNQNGVEF